MSDIRGQGLLVGVEIGATERGIVNRLLPRLVGAASQAAIGQWMSLCLLENGVLIQPAAHRWDVLKFEPPPTINEAGIDTVVAAVKEVFETYPSVSSLAIAIVRRLSRQAMNGGAAA